MTPCSWKSQTWIVSPFLQDKRLGAGVSHEFSVKLLAETSVISRLGWGKICFQTCSVLAVLSFLLAVDQRPLFLLHMSSLMDLHNTADGSPGASDPKESGEGEWEGPRQRPWCLLGFIFHLCVNNISRSHAFLSNIMFFKKEEILTIFLTEKWENYRPSF